MRAHMNYKYDLFEEKAKPHYQASTENVWGYLIHDDHQGHIESDEFYYTSDEAESACIDAIERMCDGDVEPNYDAPTFQETYQAAWEQDRLLKGRK